MSGRKKQIGNDSLLEEDASPKKREWSKKTNLFMGDYCGTIIELKEQNLVKAKEKVQKHDDEQQAKKCNYNGIIRK